MMSRTTASTIRFTLAQRRVMADVSRRIFGHVGYVGNNDPTGRKQLRSQLAGPRVMAWIDDSIPQELGVERLIRRARNYEKALGKKIKSKK